jgi:hypothetical protein
MQALDAEFVGEMCGTAPTALAEPKHQVHLHLRPTQDEAQRDDLEIQVLHVCVCVYVYKVVYVCFFVSVYYKLVTQKKDECLHTHTLSE